MPDRFAMIRWPASCSMIVRIKPTMIEIVTHDDGRASTSSAIPITITATPVTALRVSTGGASSSGFSQGDTYVARLAMNFLALLTCVNPVRFQNV